MPDIFLLWTILTPDAHFSKLTSNFLAWNSSSEIKCKLQGWKYPDSHSVLTLSDVVCSRTSLNVIWLLNISTHHSGGKPVFFPLGIWRMWLNMPWLLENSTARRRREKALQQRTSDGKIRKSSVSNLRQSDNQASMEVDYNSWNLIILWHVVKKSKLPFL